MKSGCAWAFSRNYPDLFLGLFFLRELERPPRAARPANSPPSGLNYELFNDPGVPMHRFSFRISSDITRSVKNFIVLLCLVMLFAQSCSAQRNGLSVKTLAARSGEKYRFYDQNRLWLDLSITRPDPSDRRIWLSIPAAFTTHSGKIGGLYAYRGTIQNRNLIDTSLGGAIEIAPGSFKIFPTGNGKCFNKDFHDRVEKEKLSLFQQFQIVEKGVPAQFKDRSRFQRRAIVQFNDGRQGIVESDESVSFERFNADLAELGVKDALYTDMGAWSEGWYRDAGTGEVIPIGNDRSLTNRQTNWVIFREPSGLNSIQTGTK